MSNQRLKIVVNWVFFLAAMAYSCFHVYFVISNSLHETPWLMTLLKEHFAAIVVLPFAGYAALALVLLLESRYDTPLEIKAFGFEFKGASGPIVLWAVCMLSIVAGIKALW